MFIMFIAVNVIVGGSSCFLVSLNCCGCLPWNGSVVQFHLSEALGRLYPTILWPPFLELKNALSVELPFPCNVLPVGCVTTIHGKRTESPEWQRKKLQQMGSQWKLGTGREHRIG